MRLFFCVSAAAILFTAFTPGQKPKPGTITIRFINTIDGEKIFLTDRQYINSFNEQFSVEKLKYYVSNVSLQSAKNKSIAEKNSYHLIVEPEVGADTTGNQFSFAVKPSSYQSVSFMIGVDSSKNVSGAQTGALDPLNGMFWEWNTGYIMFKMEGQSPKASMANKKYEYHIGGFSGVHNTLRMINLSLPQNLQVKNGEHIEITIEAAINDIWRSVHPFKILTTPVCTTTGTTASNIADNYSKIFSIRSVIHQ